MPEILRHIHGENVLVSDKDGPPLRDEQDALDLIGRALFVGEDAEPAHWTVIPVERLRNDFFQLSTGIAGAIAQKLAMYRLGLAVVGDISSYTAASPAFNDFVVEANRGSQMWFLPTIDNFEDRLAAVKSIDEA